MATLIEEETAELFGEIHQLPKRILKPSTYDPTTTLGKLVVGSGWIILMAQKPKPAISLLG